MCAIGMLGILVIVGIVAFKVSFVLGLIYVFILMFLFGGTIAGYDDDSWYK